MSNPDKKDASPYIDILYAGPSASGKTHIWHVVNKTNDNDIPGIIKWSGGWRKYVYHSVAAYYDAACLQQISTFLRQATEAHKLGELPLCDGTISDDLT